ncbi:MAG: head GIN domain-containing protein [Bacteroidota bacterium]|nr:head GIN domain-containing protein [Bacteroidota bacterium]
MKLKLYIFGSMLYTVTFISTSCKKDGELKGAETRNFTQSGFTGVDASNKMDVIIKEGPTAMSISGDGRDLNELTVEQSGNILVLKYKKNRDDRQPMKVNITLPNLSLIRLSGETTIIVDGRDTTESLVVEMSGNSHADFLDTLQNFEYKLSGNSDIKIKGKARTLRGEQSGNTIFAGYDFLVNNATISASGNAKAFLNVSSTLKFDASGNVEGRYKGNPTVEKTLSGNAKLEKQ